MLGQDILFFLVKRMANNRLLIGKVEVPVLRPLLSPLQSQTHLWNHMPKLITFDLEASIVSEALWVHQGILKQLKQIIKN